MSSPWWGCSLLASCRWDWEVKKMVKRLAGRGRVRRHLLAFTLRRWSLVKGSCRLSPGSSSTQHSNAGVCFLAYLASPDGDLSACRKREVHWKGKEGVEEECRWNRIYTSGQKYLSAFFFSLPFFFLRNHKVISDTNKRGLCDKSGS